MSADVKTTISGYLAKMGLESTFDAQKNLFQSRIKIKNNVNGNEFDFPIAVVLFPDGWVSIEIAVIDLRDKPPELSLEKIYAGMLRANLLIPEVNYALYDSMIISIAWSHKSALNYENFMAEFSGVVSGVANFGRIISYAKSFSAPPPKEFSPIYQ